MQNFTSRVRGNALSRREVGASMPNGLAIGHASAVVPEVAFLHDEPVGLKRSNDTPARSSVPPPALTCTLDGTAA